MVVGTMGLLIAMELFTLIFAMNTLSAVRAFVAGEGYWSKAQKDAIFSLQKYAITQDDKYFLDFNEFMKIPLGDRIGRIELMKPVMNEKAIFEGFVAGKNHPDDIPGMIKLIRNYRSFSYLAEAIKHWTEADELLEKVQVSAERLHQTIQQKKILTPKEVNSFIVEISELNERLTKAEDGFSHNIGLGSRWLERLLLIILIIAVIMIEGTGLYLTISFSRNLSKVLKELNKAAQNVGRGNFGTLVQVSSQDELGQLAHAINDMTANLRDKVSAVNIRDEFVSLASHELKTPLTSLKLQAQMRKRKIEKSVPDNFDPAKILKMANEDEVQLNRLIRLVDDMLDISRIRSGSLTLERQDTNFNSLIEMVLQRLAPQIEESKTKVTLNVNKNIIGNWDSYRIEQVLINLLTNAIKYGNSSPIIVSCHEVNGTAILSVKDQGIGISTEDKNRIFKQFERAKTNQQVSGLGLGLYIVKNIVDAHSGRIEVESELGKGTTFTVYLPLELRPIEAI